MILEGVHIEGVGPFAHPRQIALGPGTVILRGDNESGKSTLLDLVALLLDPDPELEIAPFLRTNPSPQRSHALLELRDADGRVRITADFDARELWLQEGDGPVLEGPPEAVCEALRRRLRLPARGSYERLFTLSSERLGPMTRGGRLGDAQRVLEAKAGGRSVREARAQVDALAAKLAWVREREVQHGLRESERERLEEIEAGLRASREAQEELERVEKELARSQPLAQAPADLDARLADFRRLDEELREGHATLERSQSDFDAREAVLRTPSLQRRALFGGGAALVAGGVALWWLSSLLAPPVIGLGVAVLVAAGVSALRLRLARAVLSDERSEAQDRLRMLRHRFELETVAVRSLATALGLRSPDELPEAVARYRELASRQEETVREVAELGTPAELESEMRTVRARLAAIPEPVPEAVEEDSASLRVRLEAAERELRLAERAAQDAAARAAADEVAPSAWLVEGLVRAACAFRGGDPAGVWADAEELAGAYLRALTGRRYLAVRRKGDARYLLEREGAAPLPVEDATGAAAEAFNWAIQFALVERVAPAHPLPLLLDDPFVRLDAQRRRGAARCLRRLGAVTQVILATHETLFDQIADRVVTL